MTFKRNPGEDGDFSTRLHNDMFEFQTVAFSARDVIFEWDSTSSVGQCRMSSYPPAKANRHSQVFASAQPVREHLKIR